MAPCPACSRPNGPGRPRCLYCGAALPELPPAPEAAAGPAETADPGTGRDLVACDPGAVTPEALGAVLGLGAYEAGQLVRRGGWQALRSLPPAEAAELATRLRAAGAAAEALAEAETRRAGRPVPVTGGALLASGLELDTDAGPVTLAAADLLLIVRGPIAREYQAQEAPGWRALRRVRLTNPQPGYRFHLHRRAEDAPLELDPAEFAFREKAVSAQLQLGAWCDALARDGVADDDGFRRLAVALSYAPRDEEEPGAKRGAPRREKEGDRLLDNLAQFRAYSAWRGVLARRHRVPPPK
ncbi:MAG: hypothetical protein NDJ94_14930 [Vicinamibacteria bacterium]|jgi:hypothetical protein|nr:hypothetical protein [Vicinamibacteria bacterium]